MSSSHTLADAARRLDGRQRVYAVGASVSGVGTSYVARELTLEIAKTARTVLLVEMDLASNIHHDYFSNPEAQSILGAVTGPYNASYNRAPFWQVSPTLDEDPVAAQAKYMGLYQNMDLGIAFSSFLWGELEEGQGVHIVSAPDYWKAVRGYYDVVILDIPALDRSAVGQTVFAHVDGLILVTPDIKSLDNQLVLNACNESGGRCIGAIINSVPNQSVKTQVSA